MLGGEDIDNLLDYYDQGKLCLPSIQRGYEWAPKQVAGLIKSLYRDIPIGLFLFWQPDDIKHFKPLKGRKSKDPIIGIIDGQQRLTSLHKVAEGDIPVVFDLSSDAKFQIESPKTKVDPNWVRIKDVWDTNADSKFKRQLANKIGISGADKDELDDKLDKIQAIKKQTLHNHTISHNDYGKITEIFITINEAGTKLQPSDTVFALAALKFPGDVTEKLTDMQEKNKMWKTGKSKRNDFFIKGLASIGAKTIMMDRFKDYLLQPKTTKPKMKSHLRDLRIGLERTYEFLQEEFGITEKNNNKLISNLNALVLLVNLFSQTKGKLPKKQTKLLKLWLFLAFHYSQYIGQAYKNIEPDTRAINPSDIHGTIKFWLNSMKTQFGPTFKINDLGSGLNDRSRFGVFFALKENNASDWWTGTSVEGIQKNNYHHIFPQKPLQKAGYTKAEINDPRNIAVIGEYVNKKQKHRIPVDYFNDRNLISDPDRLFNQFVPKNKDLWEVGNYKNFLEARGKLIMKKLQKFVDATKIPKI